MNWKNIDLNSPFETSRPILDPYTTDDLLLEAACNCKEINPDEVRKQAMYELNLKYKTAVEILEDNLANIVAHAKKERAKP